MGVTSPGPPAPQDTPPPQGSFPSQDKKAEPATSWQLSSHLRQSSELEATTYDVFSENGRERVLLVVLPLNDLLSNKSPTLISLATLWVSVLLRKAVRIKHWSWAYVIRILNNEAASITFDELFGESIHCSQGDITTHVFLSVLQNELLQHELFNFLREFAENCVAKRGALGLHKLQDLKIMISYGVMESSELRIEFESFTRGGYERVLQECTIPDSSDEPPHLTAYLTILLDDADVSERLPTGCSGGEYMYKARHVTSNDQYTGQKMKCHTLTANSSNCVSLNVTFAEPSTIHPKSEDSNSICDSEVSESETEDSHGISVGVQNTSAGFEDATHRCMSPGAPQSPQVPQQESEENQDTSGVDSMSDCEYSDSSFNYHDEISRIMNSSRMENQTIPTGCSAGVSQPTTSSADDPPPSSRGAESISKVQNWLSRSYASSSSSGDCQNQRIPNKGKSAFKPRQGNAVFRDISSSGSDSEQVGCHGFRNPTRFFPTVAETSETLFEILPSRASTIHGENMESTNELLPPGDTPLHSTVRHNITPNLQTIEQCNPNVVDNDTNIHSGSLNSTKEAAQLCFQELASKGKSIRMVATGQVGQGKSKLVNSLMGKVVAKEGTGPRSVTHNLENYTDYINGVKVTIVDTPGFNDVCISDKDTTLELAKEICEEPVDLILFCVRMDRRIETEIDTIIQNMTLMLERSIWRYAIFVLTFANKVDPASFAETQAEWDRILHEYARTKGGVQADIAQRIPVVVAGSEEESLPGCESWFARFWVTAHNRIKKNGYLALTGKLNRLASGDEKSSKDAVHSESGRDTSYVCTGTSQQPISVNTSPNDVGEQLVYSTEQNEEGVSIYRQSNRETSHIKLPAHGSQESVDTRHPITERENANDTIVMSLHSAPPPPPPQLWHTKVLQNSSNLESLKTFIQSLPVEVVALKDAEQGKTLCHALAGLVGEQFSSTDIIYLLGLLGREFIQQCMVCQDLSGKTPLHCAVEAKTHELVMFLLRFATCESVMVVDNDGLTALELSHEMELWSITQLLIEHQIETGASCAAELFQEYFFKVMKEEGGSEFLPRLLGLKEHYCPDLDLNFSEPRSSRTPWWYLARSMDACTLGRMLRTLKDHSIEFESLKIHSGNGKNLVKEAKAKNKVLHTMIQIVTECQQLPPPNAQPVKVESSSTESSSSATSSESGMTSLEADDSSDGGSEGLLSKAKRSTKRTRKKTIPAVQQRCPITTGTKKRSNLSVVYQRSGYSGDDSDHKNICSQTKSSKFTSAQRAAAIKKKERFNKESSSEYSGAETENWSVQIRKATDREPTSAVPSGIKLTFQGASCTLQIINCLSLIITPNSKSTELHHAVRCQSLQSVRNILACDGREDQIQMMDEEGHTPLQIASQNKDLQIFEFLLESLICSQVTPSVTLPPCSGHHQMALLASIVKVLSKKELDIDDSTLHWIMGSCQHWEIPRVVYTTPTTVLTMALMEIELLWSYQNQLLMDTLLNSDHRTGSKKKRLMQIAQKGKAIVPSVAAATQELAVTAGPTSLNATTDRTAEDSCYKSSSAQFTHKQSENQELAAVQEQGTIFQSEMVSVTRMGDLILIRAYTNSLVTGLTPLHSKGLELRQVRTKLKPTATDKKTLPRVAADSPSYSQPKSPAGKLPTQRQVSWSSDTSLWSLRLKSRNGKEETADSQKEVTAWQTWINKAVDFLHAGYYSQMLEVLKFGKVPPSFPPEIAMAAQFGCALAYYKLEKHSEAAKHLESLKIIAASAQSHGNESIASVYLGEIEFTQSRYTEAAKHYSHALKLYKSDNLGKEYQLIVPTFSAISSKLGTAFRNTSKVVDAVQAYRQAIATADSKKDELSAHTSLGNLFQSVGKNASALAEYEHSIKLSEELQDYVSLGWAHGNMGNTYLGLYQRDKGLYHLEKALDLTVEHEPTPQAIGRAYNNLGTAFQALNELDKAEEKYNLALSQSIYGNDIPGQARVYGNIGNVLMLRKNYDRAVPHYTEVLRLSRDRSTVSISFHNRGCSYYEWAESKKATLPQKARFSLHGPDFENCEVEHQLSFKSLPNSILKYYQLGRQDLEQVIKYHEETFENIKGSSKGLTLSVSLFETNSRTFHRLQDCLVNLGEWEKALVVAEQSRTRTLGELLVKRKNSKIDHPLTAPLNLQSITDIVQSQHSVVVYLSYTGARLLGWVLAPTPDKVSVDMFEVPLEDDQFDGKSFDYHLRYSLTEELVERSFEMYRAVDYKSDLSEPVRKLYKLVCKPLMKILKELKDPDSSSRVQEMIIIPDSYTCLLPFPCLLDEEDKFLGDSYSFRIMPSLLTMGIVDQLPSVVVQVPADGRSMCVVGNPTIPSFVYNGDQWSLGKLPFATREAEWVANILKTTPILHEQATKDAILMRIMNAKVIHIATHGSASAGFLAFAGMSSARNGETVEAKNILLYPDDIEQLTISPALVVLSSCDSARGTVKADGILGMARAFILAGAQAVLTTLWRVPDESASVFMQFFYQYLMDGLKASLALQKSTLSVRCFSKYSQYIHWSGYQLTGREIQFDIAKPSTAASLEARLGKSSVFPRLDVIQQLQSAFLKDPCASSDVQILKGPPGVMPSEPLVDFIHSFHDAFKGGIFWINGRTQEFVNTSAAYIKKSTGISLQTHPVLVVFDYIDQLPQFSTSLFKLLKHSNTHIVVISKNYAPPDALLKEIDNQLLRGCNIIDVKPLPPIHTTQRIIHSILSAHHVAPTNEDQDIFEKLAQFTSGSPALIDVTAALFLSQMEHHSQNESQGTHDTLINFSNRLSLDELDPSAKPVTIIRREPPKDTAKSRKISKNVYDNIVSIRATEQDPWCTDSPYDSWQAVTILIDQCHLSAEEKLLLFAVSMFSCSPVPMSVVTEISSMIATASQKPHISTSLHSKLFQMQLMKRYPLPVILHPSLGVQQLSTEPEFVYIPHYITRAIWKDMMSDRDKVMALTTMYMALRTLADNLGSSDVGFLTGLTSLLMELYELNYELMGKQCYQEVYKLYLHSCTRREMMEEPSKEMMLKDGSHPTPAPDTGATPTPPTDTGATPHDPTPAPDTGATPYDPTPAPDTDAIPHDPTEQGEESNGQSSNKKADIVDYQHPETKLSEDSSSESSSGSDMTSPEADDELSSSDGSVVKHKRTMPAARKCGVTTKEMKSSSLTLSKCSVYTPERDVKLMMTQLTTQSTAETRPCNMKPTMAQLTMLKTAKGDVVKTIQTIAPDWKDLGYLMDFDQTGSRVSLIEAEYAHQRNGVLTCCQEIFKLWLRRGDATWVKLNELLIVSDYKGLAEQVMDAVSLL